MATLPLASSRYSTCSPTSSRRSIPVVSMLPIRCRIVIRSPASGPTKLAAPSPSPSEKPGDSSCTIVTPATDAVTCASASIYDGRRPCDESRPQTVDRAPDGARSGTHGSHRATRPDGVGEGHDVRQRDDTVGPSHVVATEDDAVVTDAFDTVNHGLAAGEQREDDVAAPKRSVREGDEAHLRVLRN